MADSSAPYSGSAAIQRAIASGSGSSSPCPTAGAVMARRRRRALGSAIVWIGTELGTQRTDPQLTVDGLTTPSQERRHALVRRGMAKRFLEQECLGQQPVGGVRSRSQHRRLGPTDRLGREAGDPGRQPIDERPELPGGQRSIQPPPVLEGCGVDVVSAEHDLHRPSPAQHPRQPLGPRAAGEDAQRDLHLAQRRLVDGAEPHVARCRELAAPSPDPPVDLTDGGDGHRSVPLTHLVETLELGAPDRGITDREGQDLGHVVVGDEEVRIGAAQHQDPGIGVLFEVVGYGPKVGEELDGQQVHRAVVDLGNGDPVCHRQSHGIELRLRAGPRRPGVGFGCSCVWHRMLPFVDFSRSRPSRVSLRLSMGSLCPTIHLYAGASSTRPGCTSPSARWPRATMPRLRSSADHEPSPGKCLNCAAC